MIDTTVFQNKTAVYYTLGCKLNFSETSTIGKILREAGVRTARKGEKADLCIVNTCSVTEMADKKCRQAIHRLVKQHPGAFVVVTGCYAQLKPGDVAKIEGVDVVLGAEQKKDLLQYLGDLHKHLQENPMTQRLAAIISRFVTGSAQSFNRQTNVDLSNKYIVLDLSELKGKLLPVGMFIALDYVWDQIKSDRTKRKAIFIDEIWQLIGASSNRMAAEFCLEIFKVIRGFGGAAISATQDLSDFFGLEDGKYGRAIINNSKNKIILNLEPDEARYVQETLKLTRTEIRAITRFERGEALISSNNNKVPVVVKASKLEKEMITTDRAELEAILKERQREKTHSA